MAAAAGQRASTTKNVWNEFAFTGPGTLAGRYLRRFWQPVYRSDDLPIGRPQPIRIMSEDFTLYRGESGLPQVVDYRCAHRGTQLTVGWVEGDEIRCRYHGWKFGPDGRCTEQPGEPEPFCEKVRIKSYPTREYVGLVFAYLGEGAPPELPRYPAFELAGTLAVEQGVRECNFFNNLENDPVHVHFTHHRTHQSWHKGVPEKISAEETPHGIYSIIRANGKERSQPFILMPQMRYRRANVTSRQGRDTLIATRGDIITWIVPIDDVRHQFFHVERFAQNEHLEQHLLERRQQWYDRQTESVQDIAAKIFRGEMHLDDIPVDVGADIHWINLIEDYATQVGQGAIPDRTAEHLGRTDEPVILLRKVWQRELRSLAEGGPLTQWTPPPAE